MARTIQSLERAAAVLRLLAGGERRLGLSDVASSLGLAKGTAHGILRTLQQEGFVEQDPATGKYQLGAELLRLGNSYLDVHELRARALVWTDDLARSSGESGYLGVLHQQGVLIVHHVFRPDDSRQVLEVGAMQPLHSTALGKVLAALDPVARSEAAGRGTPGRSRSAPSRIRRSFEAVLELTRARGWAADVEETWEGWPRSPRPSTTGGGCRSARWGSPAPWSGSARTRSCSPGLSPRYGTRHGRSPGTWAPAVSERRLPSGGVDRLPSGGAGPLPSGGIGRSRPGRAFRPGRYGTDELAGYPPLSGRPTGRTKLYAANVLNGATGLRMGIQE